MKFNVGDIVVSTDQVSGGPNESGHIGKIFANYTVEDAYPYLVDWGSEIGDEIHAEDELEIAPVIDLTSKKDFEKKLKSVLDSYYGNGRYSIIRDKLADVGILLPEDKVRVNVTLEVDREDAVKIVDHKTIEGAPVDVIEAKWL